MKLLVQKDAYERVRGRITADLDVFAVDRDGVIWNQDQAVEAKALAPDIIWASPDTWETGRHMVFFETALTGQGVKWMQTFNAGLDLPIFRQIFDRGVRLSNSSAQSVAIAEYVMAMVLANLHPVERYRELQAAHDWSKVNFREVSQTSWLVIGYGNIGREVAVRAKGFGAHVTGIRRSGQTDPAADEMDTLASISRHLPEADIVVLACPLNDESRDIANAAFFAQMKPGSFLVNIGRGGLLDEDALIAALAKDRPALAILDVTRTEPLPTESPLWDHPKVRLSAHTSAFGSGSKARGDTLFVTNLARFLAGDRLLGEADERSF